MSGTNDVIKQSIGDPTCEISKRINPFIPTELDARLPQEARDFRRIIEKATLFSLSTEKQPLKNDWELFPINGFGLTVNQWIFGSEAEERRKSGGSHPYYDECFLVATSTFCDDFVAINLNDDRHGWMFACWTEAVFVQESGPVIAKSFYEWLLRTIDAGPSAEWSYWRLPEFETMGEIPGFYAPEL